MKKKHILLAVLIILTIFDVVYACATCFGDPNSKATQGMNMAIIAMLTLTGGVLSSFISFIYVLNKRAKDYAKKLSKSDNNSGGN